METKTDVCKKIAYLVYTLYLISIIVPLLPIIAVCFAYIFDNDGDALLKTHYQYMIRSFWIGALYFLIAGLSIFFLIGFLLVPLALIWWIIRIVKGLKSLLNGEPISRPKTWIF